MDHVSLKVNFINFILSNFEVFPSCECFVTISTVFVLLFPLFIIREGKVRSRPSVLIASIRYMEVPSSTKGRTAVGSAKYQINSWVVWNHLFVSVKRQQKGLSLFVSDKSGFGIVPRVVSIAGYCFSIVCFSDSQGVFYIIAMLVELERAEIMFWSPEDKLGFSGIVEWFHDKFYLLFW